MSIHTLCVVNITLRMTQENGVGVISLGVTDVSPMYRSVLCDKISHPGHLLTLHVCDLIVGQHVSVKKFVCVFVGSEIIPVSSCASAYRASGQVANVLI